MTLSTNIYVLDQIDAHEVFRFCQEMLGRYDEDRRGPDQQRWSDGEGYSDKSARRIGNNIGQGLPAILDITYRDGAPLTTKEQSAEHDEDCDSDCSGRWHDRACWLDIDFDTAYGYSHNGMGCADLHAAFIGELGQWLDAKGIRWEWRNEYTGEVHGGDERYSALAAFMADGFSGTAWFQHTVLPALMR
jgi:hypothetical protein